MNLDKVEYFLRSQVAPNANTIDGSSDALLLALQGLGSLNLLA
ncbi:acyl-CoA dehydrogenase, partial [Brunnivagina elsteri CCALA 953]